MRHGRKSHVRDEVETISAEDMELVPVRGAGRASSTGIDLKQLAAGQMPHEYYEHWDRALRTLELAETVLICAMQGYALGGGLQLALVRHPHRRGRLPDGDHQEAMAAYREGRDPDFSRSR
jgi:enoyl-CoA hydratase/carnithine racemase